MNAAHPDFVEVERLHGNALLHKSHPVWIVHYEGHKGFSSPSWRVYESVCKVPAGRDPWTVDNRYVGQKDGFTTIDEALTAALERVSQ